MDSLKVPLALALILPLFCAHPLHAKDNETTVSAKRTAAGQLQPFDKADAPTPQILRLLADGRLQEAYAQMVAEYRNGRYGSQGLFYLATTAKKLERYDECEAFFRELMKREPQDPGIRLDLARVLYQNGDTSEAREILSEIKSLNPPSDMVKEVDRFIALIDKERLKMISGYATVGMLYDTNAAIGPVNESILLYEEPFSISINQRPSKDWASTLNAGFTYNQGLAAGANIRTDISFKSIDYFNFNQFDYYNISFSTAPVIRNRRFSFSLPYVFNLARYRYDEAYTYLANGFAPQLAIRVSQKMLLAGSVAYAWKIYLTNTAYSSQVMVAKPSIIYDFTDNITLALGGYAGNEKAHLEACSNDGWGVNGSVRHRIGNNSAISIGSSFSSLHYKEDNTLPVAVSRKDNTTSITTAYNYLLEPLGTNINISYTWSHNISTISDYQYSRNQTMLFISKNF